MIKKGIIIEKKVFEPYVILVETREEDLFLKGISDANGNDVLKDCKGYHGGIHSHFMHTLNGDIKGEVE